MTIELDPKKIQHKLSIQRSLSQDQLAVAEATVEQLNEILVGSFKALLTLLVENARAEKSKLEEQFKSDESYAKHTKKQKISLVNNLVANQLGKFDNFLPGFADWRKQNGPDRV